MAPTTYSDVLARNIRAARSRQGLSQADVVERMRALGFSAWHKPTLGNVERGQRRVQAEEILGLAACLATTVQRLMTPLWEDKWVEFPNGMGLRVGAVVSLVSSTNGSNDGEICWHGNTPVRTIVPPHEGQAMQWEHALAGLIVAAIVTSSEGVLITARKDGRPPWGFVTGEIEPNELPEDAAVREVKEETGLEVRAGQIIGERDHLVPEAHGLQVGPCRFASLDVFVGDTAELADVRWADLGQADVLLPNMYEPVHAFLARELGES